LLAAMDRRGIRLSGPGLVNGRLPSNTSKEDLRRFALGLWEQARR
jgi:hypothetical protein